MENQWHQHILRVHYKDTDQMGVAHHANYVGWFEIGRTEMMRSAGVAYSEMEKLGLLLPVVHIDIQYRRPAHYDNSIAVFTKVMSFSAVRLQFEYEIRRIEEDLSSLDQTNVKSTKPYGKLLSKGTTKHIWVDHKWKPARIDKVAPDVFTLLQDKFGSAEK
jgi:acyl-CoA thioester hydrolase